MKFTDKFLNALERTDSYLCIGIDPDPGKIPAAFPATAEGIYNFCREVIATTSDLAAAYKFNLAFFERWGWAGWQTLENLLEEVPPEVLTIGDAKRGDIGNSSRFYAQALQDTLGFDAVTLSPYLGSDSILPFIEDETRGAFVLCVTSNPSGKELQEHGANNPLYIRTAELVQNLNERCNLGLVMGATRPEQLIDIRQRFPDLPFLIPGVGSQGGGVATALDVCRRNGLGLINVSRGILFSSEGQFPDNIRQSALHYKSQFKR